MIWATWIAVELLIALGCLAILTATDEEDDE
jgi:putative Mn2+ efflux pump MntP